MDQHPSRDPVPTSHGDKSVLKYAALSSDYDNAGTKMANGALGQTNVAHRVRQELVEYDLHPQGSKGPQV
jgi:hypothetical protein